jgi:hypothetical protein
MLGLRTLIFLLFGFSAYATTGYFRSSTMSLGSQGSPSTVQQTESSRSNGLTQIFEITSPTLAETWTVTATSKLSKLDSSQLQTSDDKGNQVFLPSENQVTHFVTGTLSFAKGSVGSTVSVGQSLDSSVFKSRLVSADFSYKIDERAAALGFNYSRLESERPTNYVFDNFFTNSSLTWIPRPERITRERSTVSFEQIWSDEFKNRAEFFLQARNEERPSSAGAVLKNYYVLSTRNSVRLDLGTASEDRRQSLADERGYFQMNWLETQLQRLLTYNFLVGVSYGLLQEREDEVRSGRVSQTASDVYGLKAQYSGRGWQGTLKLEALEANTAYRTQQVQGVLQWDI